MIGHTRVVMLPWGSAAVNEGSVEYILDAIGVEQARMNAKTCCESRKVYYPQGAENCPCLACHIAKALEAFHWPPEHKNMRCIVP